ncbi:hypothetical protein GGF43_001677 [Coemansia sp. RSA 2618]|nr:hypothetical protein GGF43_001677 [Coemansia sp. RSA 2618]
MAYIPKPPSKQPTKVAPRRYSAARAAMVQPGSVVKTPSYSRYEAVQGAGGRRQSHTPSIVRLEPESEAVTRPSVDRSTSFSNPNGRNSTRATTATNPDATVFASGRQRTRSIDTAALERQHSASRHAKHSSSKEKRRFELPRVRFAGWSKDSQQGARSAGPDKQLWSGSETARLAQECMRFWASGQTVNYQQVARNLQRSVADVRMMLQHMLQEHVLCAHKKYWPDRDQAFVSAWAAMEFPKCPVLNPQGAAPRRITVGLGGLNRCFSALRCQPPNQSDSWAVDSPEPCIEPSVAIITSTRSSTPEQPADPPAVEAANMAPKKSVTIVTDTEFPPVEKIRPASAPAVRDTRDAATFASDFTFRLPPSWSVATGVVSTAPRKKYNAAGKPTLVKRMREARSQRVKASSKNNPVALPSLNMPPVPVPELPQQPVTVPNGAASYLSDILGMGNAMAVFDADEQEEELSPEQSQDTYDINRLDGDIDIQFFDVTAKSRKEIRNFVDRYVDDYFNIFYYRAVRPDITTRHCNPFHEGGSIELVDSALVDEIEKELQQFDILHSSIEHTIDLNKADLHFHVQFARAAERCCIYEGDANWQSANLYAIAVLNRMIEDVHYLAFEDIDSASRVSIGSNGGTVQYVRTDKMAKRANAFNRMYYMGIMASQLTTRYVQSTGRNAFWERVGRSGYRPVPTALDYEDELSEEGLELAMSHAWTDVSIRAELFSLMMDMVPHTTNESTMVMMQRAIEIYNKTILSYQERLRNDLDDVFSGPMKDLGIYQKVFESVEQSRGVVSVAQVSKLAQGLADRWFDQLRRSLLKALMADYQLRPVSLAAVRRWIAEDRAPNGKGVDFNLNTRLYTYFKNLRVQMNEAKWMYASAAATLRVIELIKDKLTRPHLLEHVSVSRYAELFRKHISKELGLENARASKKRQELFVLPLDAESPNKAEDDTSTQVPSVDLNRGIDESRIRLEQLALAAAAAPPMPRLDIPTSPKAASMAERQSINMSTRLDHLELEVTSIRREMHGFSDMRRDVGAILAALHAQKTR